MICVTCICWLVVDRTLRRMTVTNKQKICPAHTSTEAKTHPLNHLNAHIRSTPKPQLYGDHCVTYCKHPIINQTGCSWNITRVFVSPDQFVLVGLLTVEMYMERTLPFHVELGAASRNSTATRTDLSWIRPVKAMGFHCVKKIAENFTKVW